MCGKKIILNSAKKAQKNHVNMWNNMHMYNNF